MENTSNITYPNSLYKLAKERKLPHAIIIESKNIEKSYEEAIKAVNILLCKSDNQELCGKCSSCVKISNRCHPDIKTISLDSDLKHIKIDSIRVIRQDAYIIPNESSHKIYILKSSDYLTVQAQNAFIKILEEPPEKVIFILLCENISTLLDTIISRCVVFRSFDSDLEDHSNRSEIYNLSKEIVKLSFQKDKLKILELVSNINSDRGCLKELSESIIRNFIDLIKHEGAYINISELVEKIDCLKYITKANDRNVNINLLLTYLVAIL